MRTHNTLSSYVASTLALTTTVVGATIENTVSATSLSTCNPVSATATCSADTALATSISDDFTSYSDNYSPYRGADQIYYSDEGLVLTLAERYDNPSLVSNFYIMFGKIEVMLKSANGTGIVSSFYLQSDDLDEIDMEWFGGDASQMQSNFFSKGDTSTYDRGEYHDMTDPRESFHNYTLDWDEESLKWYIDGELVRTLSNSSDEGYPQSPSRVYFGIWAGGDSSNSEGTIEWAGGSTDYSEAPFSMYIQKLVVTDYSTGSEYEYSDSTGDWTSITAVDGEVLGRKVIAEAEFASLVNSDSSSSDETNTSKKATTSSKTSAAYTITSVSHTSSKLATHKTVSSDDFEVSSSSVNSESESSSSTTEESSSDSETLSSSTKTVNLKSKYLSSSTTTLVTKSTAKSSTTSSDSSSASSSVSVQSNAANSQFYAGSSFLTALVFMISML